MNKLFPPVGLFHQAIQQSGSDITLWAVNSPESEPEEYTAQMAILLDCPADQGTAAMIQCLRTKDEWEIVSAAGNITCRVRRPTTVFDVLPHF